MHRDEYIQEWGNVVPTYEYKCNECGSQREVIKEFGDDSVPTCCQVSMTRVWSSTPVIFKTGGFYSTGG
jgi:putative FmdB family regulatory protein